MLRGHVFNKQLFTSECFALFIDTFLGKNSGIVTGCELSNLSDSISIGNGYFCIKGRFLEEVGGSTFEIESTEGDDIYCRLICEIDLSQENTTSELKQASYKILKSTSDYPILQQEDITSEGSIYQFEFARFKITQNGIEEFKDQRTYLDFNSIYSEIRKNIDSFFNELDTTTKEEANQLIQDLKQYCETIKNELSGDIAANLLNKITTLEGKFNNLDVKVKDNEPKNIKNKTIQPSDWQEYQDSDKTKYKYEITDEKVTENHLVQCFLTVDEQEKITGSANTESENGKYKIILTEKPEEPITMDIVITKTGGDVE